MIKMMCEQMYRGLDNLVERLLNEKRQQISPEDAEDNKVLRSILRKMRDNNFDRITRKEKEVAERCGFVIDDNYNVLRTTYGYIDPYDGEITNPFHYTGSDQYIITDNRRKNSGSSNKNINIADIGRKRRERAKLFGEVNSEDGEYLDDIKPDYTRNEKKKVPSFIIAGGVVSNRSNYDNDERRLQNKRIQKDYIDMTYAVKGRKNRRKEAESNSVYWDNRRESIMSEIARLKRMLKDIDNEEDSKEKMILSDIEERTSEINDMLSNKRQKIQDKRDKRNKKGE